MNNFQFRLTKLPKIQITQIIIIWSLRRKLKARRDDSFTLFAYLADAIIRFVCVTA